MIGTIGTYDVTIPTKPSTKLVIASASPDCVVDAVVDDAVAVGAEIVGAVAVVIVSLS